MKFFFIKLFLLISICSCASINNAQQVKNPNFEKKIDQLIDYIIPVVTVEYAQENCSEYIFLDARELEEFSTSHIPNARHIGYDHFKMSSVSNISKDQKIIIYCSIGYRSEKVGQKMEAAGFKNIYNLYGSIFEWANRGYDIVDINGNTTQTLHTYNKQWSKWVDHPQIRKKW